MIDVLGRKKIKAIFLNLCFLAPMMLMTLTLTIVPVVSAENACEVPASNSWDIRESTNQHYLAESWMEGNSVTPYTDLYLPVTKDFSDEINVRNDSASAISMILTTGKSYTFCYSFNDDLESPSTNGAMGDVYLMTEQNWEIYQMSYDERFFEDFIDWVPVEYRDTFSWMSFRDVHTYEKVTSDYFSVSVDTITTSWFDSQPTKYYLVFDNWDNNQVNDHNAAGGELNIELLVDVEDRLMLPKFTAYILVAILPLSCLIVPFIINSKYHSHGLDKSEINEEEMIPILEQ